MSDFTPTTEEIEDWWAHKGPSECVPYYASKLTKRVNEFKAWLAEHDAKVRAETLREAYADLQAYTDSGEPFGHRPVEEFLLHRADRIEKEAGL